MLKLRTLAVVVGIAAMIVPVFTARQPALSGAGAALAVLSGPADAQAAVHRKSAACASPKGQKINISWGDGNVSTTVYFNNHCAQRRFIKLQFVRENHTSFNKCITVGSKTHGKKKIGYGQPNQVTLPTKKPAICD
jgi:hypothetical protein